MKLRIGVSQIIICVISAMILIVSLAVNKPSSMFFLCMLVFVITLVELLKNYKNNICIICFYFSLFTFLLGGELLQQLGITEKNYVFSESVDCHAFFCILLSIASLFITYIISSHSLKGNFVEANNVRNGMSTSIFYYRKISLALFYLLSIFKVITIGSAVAFTATFGYSNYYTEYSFNGPSFILKLSNMSITCFFVYLATMPTKKEIKLPLLLYLILSGLTLLVGYRNEFVVSTLFIIIYLITRDLTSTNGENWINRKYIIAIIVFTPLLISFLYSMSRTRINIDNENGLNILTGMIDFFDQQGFSINIIKWERELHDSIPSKPYSIGQTIDFFTSGNAISQLLFSTEAYRGQTVERALNGNQLSYYLSYMKFPWDYSMGYGVGSSYIAEAFHDLGYFGIAIFSSIYGIIMSIYKKYLYKNIWVTACFYIAITELLMAPRGYADSFFAQILNLTNIEVFLIIYLISKALKRKK